MKEAKWKRVNAMVGKAKKPSVQSYRVNKTRGGSSQKRSG
jgi:hypothetical protein